MDETEKKIFEAAMDVFSEDGYEGATTRRIAEKAGVNEVTLFRRFQSKEKILQCVITRGLEAILQSLDSIFLMEKGEKLGDCLRNLGHKLSQLISENIGWILLLIQEGRKRREVREALSTVPNPVVGRLVHFFEEQIQSGNMRKVNPRTAAIAFESHVFYNALARAIVNEEILGDSEKELDEFIDILLKGISKR